MGVDEPSQYWSEHFWRRNDIDRGQPGALRTRPIYVDRICPSTGWKTENKGTAFEKFYLRHAEEVA